MKNTHTYMNRKQNVYNSYSCTEKTLQWSEINFGEDITNNQTEKKWTETPPQKW